MISAALSRSHDATAAAEEHSDYFATEAHYRSLANRILAALRTGGGFVLITGDPPPEPRLLSQALRESAGSRFTIIDIASHAGLTSEELSRARSAPAALTPSESQPAAPGPAIFVLADADRLPDERIREIVEVTEDTSQRGSAGLLLTRPSFLVRLEEEALQCLKERLVARFEFQELGQEEGIEFLRHQVAARHARSEPRGIPAAALRSLTALGVLVVLGIGAFVFLQDHSGGKSPAGSDLRTTAVPGSTLGEAPTGESGPVVPNLSVTAATPQPAPQTQGAPAHDEPAPAETQVTLPKPEPASTPPPSGSQHISSAEIAAFVTRGDGFLNAGDISSARLFYERAADAGSAAAALRLGATFDPGFLGRTSIRGVSGDTAQATSWYRRARDLGDAAAADLLQGLDRQPSEPRPSPR